MDLDPGNGRWSDCIFPHSLPTSKSQDRHEDDQSHCPDQTTGSHAKKTRPGTSMAKAPSPATVGMSYMR